MKTSLPNLKKCSTANRFRALWLSAAATSLCLGLACPAWASVPPVPQSSDLLKQIRNSKSASFDNLLNRWNRDFGTSAVPSLLKIARSAKLASDSERYVAVMGAARLGGKPVASMLIPLLRDSSWMVRNGSLRALTALQAKDASPEILNLINDPALVVRLEAIDAISALKPKGASAALVSAVYAPQNYHGGRAQWAPQRALAGLRRLHATEAVPSLINLLDRSHDAALMKELFETLTALTGKSIKPTAQVAVTAREWRRVLSAR